jgi:hypothetical protein
MMLTIELPEGADAEAAREGAERASNPDWLVEYWHISDVGEGVPIAQARAALALAKQSHGANIGITNNVLADALATVRERRVPDTYIFFSDPGHGWLEVDVAELHRLNLHDKISTYSYLHADKLRAYLEEDCDMTIFLDEKDRRGEKFELLDMHDHDSAVRKMEAFK